MSTGFELVPLAIGGGIWVAGKVVKGVADAFSQARQRAGEDQAAFEQASVAFATDMRDLSVAKRALEASGIAVAESGDGLDITVDGHVARLSAHEDGSLHLVAPVAMGEQNVATLAEDLDVEYRKLVQGDTYQRVIDHARDHGLTLSDEMVGEDGSITLTLEA